MSRGDTDLLDGGNYGPDYSFGWGLVDAAEGANFLTDVTSSSPETLLEENSYKGDEEWTMEVTSNGEPLKVTIVWTDPPPERQELPNEDVDDPKSVLVNDLDLWISDPDGQTLHLPWVLDPANPENPATRGNNSVDNVEQVLIEEPLEGEQYIIHVGHKGSIKDRLQNYSLLVSGVKTGVSIEASDAFANEHDGDSGEFIITRTGDTAEPLTVSYTVEGTAINGGDYEFVSNSVTIPEGETQVTIEINPLDDNLAEGAEDVTLRLEPSDDYKVSEENEASASIFDLDDDCNDETYGFCYC